MSSGGLCMRTFIVRVLVVLVVITGVNYLAWRWLFSLNWDAWWLSVPLVIAETYALIDVMLYGLTIWRSKRRPAPPAALGSESVDVFITTYNEPVEMVLRTTAAALAITHPHETWVLDDGSRPELRLEVEALGARYIERGTNWEGQPRHAKAGNLNNALEQTSAEFVLILDADQVPDPKILTQTLGYFIDDSVAVVQTPQYFGNVPEGDPLGSQAPLFYGLIQEGKDGWNAAYFCGSNAILRREAIMQLGLARYAREMKESVAAALARSGRIIRLARRQVGRSSIPIAVGLRQLEHTLEKASRELESGAPVAQVSFAVQQEARRISQELVSSDLQKLRMDLADIPGLPAPEWTKDGARPHEAGLDSLITAGHSPLASIDTVARLLTSIDVYRHGEAQPIMPMSTISVTEDLATAMRLHARGWHSVYHHEILAVGMAPEDLRTMLGQRLRWAQGTMQVFFRENPLGVRGLSIAQRLMYFATMWSYLIGFAAVVFLAAPVAFLIFGVAPVAFLIFGVLPVSAISTQFFLNFIPYIVLCQVLFRLSARGVPTWRGQQYSFALFPTWIAATVSAAANVFGGRPLPFLVTPKDSTIDRREWRLVTWQLIACAVLGVAAVIGLFRVVLWGAEPIGTVINLVWVVFDIALIMVVIKAVSVGARRRKKHA